MDWIDVLAGLYPSQAKQGVLVPYRSRVPYGNGGENQR